MNITISLSDTSRVRDSVIKLLIEDVRENGGNVSDTLKSLIADGLVSNGEYDKYLKLLQEIYEEQHGR